MSPHDVLTLYSTKAIEYLIAVAFLLLFIPFWRWIDRPAAALAAARVKEKSLRLLPASWFQVPEAVYLHPGHAWARSEKGDVVTVGLDDFAQRLVGPVASIELPPLGAAVGQGEKGWALLADGRRVEMLSPVDGVVVAVNEEASRSPGLVSHDPYGKGWLLKVEGKRLGSNLKQLLSGAAARRFVEQAAESLHAVLSPELGAVAADGGVPVQGFAKDIDPERWDEVARSFFLS